MRNKKNYQLTRWWRMLHLWKPASVLARASRRRIADKTTRVEYDRQLAKAGSLEAYYVSQGQEASSARRMARSQFGCLAEEDAVRAGRPSHL